MLKKIKLILSFSRGLNPFFKLKRPRDRIRVSLRITQKYKFKNQNLINISQMEAKLILWLALATLSASIRLSHDPNRIGRKMYELGPDIGGETMYTISPIVFNDKTLEFRGCNSHVCDYFENDQFFKLGNCTSTKKICPKDKDQVLIQALRTSTMAKIRENTLVFYSDYRDKNVKLTLVQRTS